MSQQPPRRRFASASRHGLMLGGIAAASMTLSGCEDTPPEPAQFTSVTECTAAGYEQDLCNGAYGDALKEHNKSAPRFTSLADCEAQWGNNACGPGTALSGNSGGSVFVPLLAGFALSSLMQRSYYNNGYYGGGYIGGPIYRNRGGSTVTLGRSSAGSVVATPVNVNTTSVARSGFGGMSMSRSSGGSHGFGG